MSPDLMAAVENLVAESKAHFWHVPSTTMTCCVLALRSGFTVFGSFAYQPEQGSSLDDDDRQVARKLAFDDAVKRLTEFEAYRQAEQGPRVEIATPAQVLTLTK
ncbi:MAG: hypothetical protein ACREVL_16500 [Solimonas sp.]